MLRGVCFDDYLLRYKFRTFTKMEYQMKSLDLQSFLQNSCIEPDEFVLNVDSDFFRLLPNLLQSHNTCSHFVCIPCNINLRFLRCIYQYILECLLRSRRKVVLTGCLYVHEKHYIHILTNPFRVGNFQRLRFL